MPEVKVSEISASSRHRKEYKNIDTLAASIERCGLIHPIVIIADSKLPPYKYVLLAGGRRLQAFKYLCRETIPVTFYSNLTPLDRRIVELEENIQRSDLKWHEVDSLRLEIHHLKIEQQGPEVDRKSRTLGWNQDMTAEMLGINRSTLSVSLDMAEAAEVFPDLKEQKTQQEAKLLLKKYGRIMQLDDMREAGTLELPTDFDFDVAYQIGDAFKGLAGLESNMPNLLLAEVDPPYGVGLPVLRDNQLMSYFEWEDGEAYRRQIEQCGKEIYRVLAPDSWCLWWFAFKAYEIVLVALAEAGFKLDVVPVLWVKETTQLTSGKPDLFLARGYEQCFVARKGTPTLYGAGRSNVFTYPPAEESVKIHQAQRPVGLVRNLLRVFAPEGATVLCPFLGSGATIIAAYFEGMKCFGWDLMTDVKAAYINNVGEMV